MSRAAASLLSVLTMPGDEPWVPGDGAFRILMHPRLGWPLAPFVVLHTHHEPPLRPASFRLNGPGAAGPHDVDGEAWLVPVVFSPEDADPGLAVLHLQFDEPPEVTVVRAIGDDGPGMVTRTAEPYRLAAPAISVIRIRGRCHIDGLQVAGGVDDVFHDEAHPLGLPVPDLWPPGYHSMDDARERAEARVRDLAPLAPGPHEQDQGLDPGDAEHERVQALVAPWLMPALESWLARPIAERFRATSLDDVGGTPLPSRAELDEHAAIMVAATDPGVARWLGLSDALRRFGGPWSLVTVIGAWALPSDHDLVLAARSDPAMAHFARAVLDEHILFDIEQLAGSFHLFWGWTQAWADFDAVPDRPRPPLLAPRPDVRWTAGPTPDADVARVAVAARHTALLGSFGVTAHGATPPVHAPLDGVPGRARPLLARPGVAFTTNFSAPFATHRFTAAQSDPFGRWSDDVVSLEVAAPPRPALPRPEPLVARTVDRPSGEEPWRPPFEVRVPVPSRAAGQPAIVQVVVESEGAAVTLPVTAAEVAGRVEGPPLLPGERGTAVVTVRFVGSPAASASTVRSVSVIDPRPPRPPELPPVLRFAARADATGTSTCTVPLPAGGHISGYRVDVAHERDLVSTSGVVPPSGLGRDARARFWLDQPRQALAGAFYPGATGVVPAGEYLHPLPGDLDELVAFRLVPVGSNGASPDAAGCPLVFFAVPAAVVPPPPGISVDRSVQPAAVAVVARPGGVPAVEYRVRALESADTDPRLGRVVAFGTLADGASRIALPPLDAFAAVTLVAEVRGEAEAGVPPMPGRWSAPSRPYRYVVVPPDPPDFVLQARRDGTAIELALSEAAPDDLTGYGALIYRRDPDVDVLVVWRGPLELERRLETGSPLPAGLLAVVVIDPPGRRSSAIIVEPPGD